MGTSIVLCVLILLVGYVNGDAKRRGMSRALWTVIAIFVPNGIRIILYFLLREPLMQTCSQCHAQVRSTLPFCPRFVFDAPTRRRGKNPPYAFSLRGIFSSPSLNRGLPMEPHREQS